MAGAFSGETAGYYARYRRGYPDSVVDALAGSLGLTSADVVLDLGCGTGQLTMPIARHARVAIGMDPEPDMLAHARAAAREAGSENTLWMLGSDDDLGGLRFLTGDGALGAVTIGNAIHLMAHQRLFTQVRPMLRIGGGLAVIANGTPLWQQDSEPSRALKLALEQWLDTTLTSCCGTDRESRGTYADSMRAAGFDVSEVVTEYYGELDLEHIVGGVYSAMSPDSLPAADRRAAFAAHIAGALPETPFVEHVRVAAMIGRIR
ncbi:MAG TPA: class I SAM-dependent methyltransferase [Streptosporangiaceae bacterium]|nr:class I SAM-dependent methyltransferase [Streptosporangiaceae bacterium]